MKTIYLTICYLLLFTQCKDQSVDNNTNDVDKVATTTEKKKTETADHVAIEKVIQNYFDGWLTGDTTLVGSAMHHSCNLKFVRDGKIEIRNRTQYLSGFKPRPRLENAEGRILSIDIVRTAAEAKIELEIPSRLFTDYFNLLKEGERWYITDKVSTNVVKE